MRVILAFMMDSFVKRTGKQHKVYSKWPLASGEISGPAVGGVNSVALTNDYSVTIIRCILPSSLEAGLMLEY